MGAAGKDLRQQRILKQFLIETAQMVSISPCKEGRFFSFFQGLRTATGSPSKAYVTNPGSLWTVILEVFIYNNGLISAC